MREDVLSIYLKMWCCVLQNFGRVETWPRANLPIIIQSKSSLCYSASKRARLSLVKNALSHGRTNGGNWAQTPWHRIPGGAEKSQQCCKYFLNAVNLLPKNLRFEHRDTKLVSCPGGHLTSVFRCTEHITK